MKIVVVGDSYCPADILREQFAPLAREHEVAFVDVADAPDWKPQSPSELRLREFQGTPDQCALLSSDADVLVVQGAPVSDAVIGAAPRLRLICVLRGGPVNVDVEAASKRGIPIAITPGKNAGAVAELTIALMIAVARHIPEAMRHIESGGDFGRDNFEGARWFGHDLSGKVAGIVGFGQIGRRVAGAARAFGMRTLVSDPYVDHVAVSQSGHEAVELEALLAEADFVTLHARGQGQEPLIDRRAFKTMKSGAFFINTARAALVDEQALADMLASGRLAGAALDVVSPPPVGEKHSLMRFPNVLLLPHIGGATFDSLANAGRMAVAEIQRLIAGEPLLNVVEPAPIEARRTEVVT